MPEHINQQSNSTADRQGWARTFAKRAFNFTAYWLNLVGQPILVVVIIVGLVFALGQAQRMGYFVDNAVSEVETEVKDNVEYFCPMLCVPPTNEPGRCPVCGMELKKREVSNDPQDRYAMTIDPVARRLSNISTVVAARVPLTKKIQTFGRIGYDETSEATISAYVDGRIERMFVDYTGAEVRQGQEMAILYSPELYSAQVELFESKNAMENSDPSLQRVFNANKRLYESARRRLIEFGLPETKVDEIEASGEANSRVEIVAPIEGTVTEKMAEQGQYVKTGTPLLTIADLSKVWLMLQMFPEDASLLHYGQNVSVSIQSQPGKTFQGRVAFVSPMIDSKSQTVPVRVVIPNDARLIRIGDYATAKVQVDVTANGQGIDQIYDPMLANKWISPNHPYIVRDEPGTCPECGTELVPASTFGYVSFQPEKQGVVVVPRTAVLMSGEHSVAYVETEDSRFEFRKVTLGPSDGEQVSILDGIKPGEIVVTNAAFMLDAAFNMSQKPSLIDPNRGAPVVNDAQDSTPEQLAEIEKALSELSAEDRALAELQKICPVTEFALGSMGPPIKVSLENRDVFICCEGCRERLVQDPDKYFAILDAANADPLTEEEAAEIESALSKLNETDRELVKQQIYCPVTEMRLGSMGTPIKMRLKDQDVFICCEGCRSSMENEPDKYLQMIEQYKTSGQKTTPPNNSDVPEIDVPEINSFDEDLPEIELPGMELPK